MGKTVPSAGQSVIDWYKMMFYSDLRNQIRLFLGRIHEAERVRIPEFGPEIRRIEAPRLTHSAYYWRWYRLIFW
jgi:hypothetical protein